jgi:hypothetical protein
VDGDFESIPGHSELLRQIGGRGRVGSARQKGLQVLKQAAAAFQFQRIAQLIVRLRHHRQGPLTIENTSPRGPVRG